MTFYYKEPKAGNLWVFALDGGLPVGPLSGTNLTTCVGGLPRVGEPGSTLGGRVLPGYGFAATEGREPIKGEAPPQPTSATEAPASAELDAAIVQGEQIFRARCFGCHQIGSGTGANLFRTSLGPARFKEVVVKGREGTTMPAFGALLTTDEIWALFDFLLSRDRLE
jgi:mono/diheme cytochrome c family protein